VIFVPDVAEARAFYTDALGLLVSTASRRSSPSCAAATSTTMR